MSPSKVDVDVHMLGQYILLRQSFSSYKQREIGMGPASATPVDTDIKINPVPTGGGEGGSGTPPTDPPTEVGYPLRVFY